MASLRELLGRPKHEAVLSLYVQARQVHKRRGQSQFEMLVRHLFDRLLNNEAFGDDAALRVTQLAYAIALPGVLVALFLFAPYHGVPPYPLERSYWSQACDHLFFVMYAFTIMGTATVFQWDLLFPDLLDVCVLSSLPLGRARLLLGRVAALAIFLALVLVGTTGLGDLFFPGVADLRCGFARHFAAHTLAVSMSGVFAALSIVALQGVLACRPGRRLYSSLAPAVKILAIVVLLTTLFLFPLLAHYLSDLLAFPSPIVRLFPPFWFLALYEVLLYGEAARPILHELARTGLVALAAVAAVAALTYPIAYLHLVRRRIEGKPLQQRRFPLSASLQKVIHRALVRAPRSRAVFHFAWQTLARLQRLHLYMAMYAGLGLALVLSGIVLFQIEGGHVRIVTSGYGVRLAVPVLAFWIVAGLRTALRSPLGTQGRWVFRIVHSHSPSEELRGAEMLVSAFAVVLTLFAAAFLDAIAPPELRTPAARIDQVVMAVGLCILLTDIFFLTERTIPFTVIKASSPNEFALTLVRYLVVFPAFALETVEIERWIGVSASHLLLAVLGFAAAHTCLSRVRDLSLRRERPEVEPQFTELGLRGD